MPKIVADLASTPATSALMVIAQEVVTQLHPAERRLDEALLANVELLAGVLRARQGINALPSFGHAVVLAVKEAGDAIFEGIDRQRTAHALLAKLAERNGIDLKMLGGGTLKDDEDSIFAWPTGQAVGAETAKASA